MEERDQNSATGSKINTLEESLERFDKPCLLEQLDMNLELVRRGRETKEKHLLFMKSIDKDLLKLSRIHHPDKAIGAKKIDEELVGSQNLQITLNATRTVLKALTEEFLKDIDVHYKYEFFAKLDINTLINEKRIDIEINNVLCKISRLSEVKRVNIVGEIRKFLLESRECLRKFLEDSSHEFSRHRDYECVRHWINDLERHRNHAFRHLHKCIEGYKMLIKECELIVEECKDDDDENTKKAIEKIYMQSLRESKLLQNLEGVVKRSLGGTFEIFPIYITIYERMKPVEYRYVVPKQCEYIVLPFVFYVDVLLICSVMVDSKSRRKGVITKIGELFNYMCGMDSEDSIYFAKAPALFKAAYHLLSYFNKRNHPKEEGQMILKEKGHHPTESNVTLKEIVRKIDQHLVNEFDILSYKEGKSNREQFNEKLFKLRDSMAEFKEAEKNLQEKFKLYEKEANEIRKEYQEHYGKIGETEEEHHGNSSECENAEENSDEAVCNQHEITDNKRFKQKESHENVNNNVVEKNLIESKSVSNIEEQEKIDDDQERETKDDEKTAVEHPLNSTQSIAKPMTHKNNSNNLENTENEILHQNETIGNESHTDVGEGCIETESENNIKEQEKIHISDNETANQTAQTVAEECHDLPQELNEEKPSSSKDQSPKEPMDDQLSRYVSSEQIRNIRDQQNCSREGEEDKNNDDVKITGKVLDENILHDENIK